MEISKGGVRAASPLQREWKVNMRLCAVSLSLSPHPSTVITQMVVHFRVVVGKFLSAILNFHFRQKRKWQRATREIYPQEAQTRVLTEP